MDNLPIDIHSGKLHKWLISRRHCKPNADLTDIRKKIGEAIKDMPENDRILQLLAGSYIHYFHCKEIVEILKDTEKDSRNMFGSYSSQRMKDWKEILTLYEKDNVCLAEAAQLLQRLCQFDIPSANRQITKGENTYEDSIKKQEEYARQAIVSVAAYKSELAAMNIAGENVKKEIIALTATIPGFLEEVVTELKGLKPAIDYYDAFRVYNNVEGKIPIPFLRKLVDSGLFTYYEYTNGEAPESVEKFELVDTSKESKTQEDEGIDFGDDDGIDFGDDANDDFKIEVVDIDTGDSSEDKVARGQFALSVLEQVVSMRQFHFDMDELATFLYFRYTQVVQPNPADLHFAGIENKTGLILSVTAEMMSKWSAKIKDILKKIDNDRIKMLLKARRDHSYVDELVDHFLKLQLQEQKYNRLSELSAQKQEDSVKMIQDAKKEVEVLTNALIYLKEEIEKDIGKKYGRECNIIGEIYNVLP